MQTVRTSESILLRTDRLRVEIAQPGTLYNGSRFDWTGFITQVTLDGRATFCAPEAVDGTGTGGSGLCAEFGIFQPVGFDDAEPGDWFPKLGVGLCRRPDDEPYRFAREYEVRPFPIECTAGKGEVAFTVEPLPCRGYAVRTEKRIAVGANTLTISYRLENVGERPIATHEYCHNFLAIDGRPIGPGYALRTAFDLPADAWPGPLRACGREVRFDAPPDRAFYRAVTDLPSQPGLWWELSHDEVGARVRETTDVPWERLAVWGTPRVVSAEAFVALDVAPGRTRCWRRSYVFDRNEA